ncbi:MULTISPECIES: copper resistance CopC/CopD family protein [Listeria]|uniref:copper resistance CopC/CopD family protein n=1 Tax=Listeria TaxID=1637 RepID=UPI000B58BA1E|nr:MULTISPECIES: copper resistance CopC/CopD family protein [Listeria]
MAVNRFWQGFLIFFLLILFPATHADAHAYLQNSTPADGSSVAKMPAEIVLTYNETIKSDFPLITVTNSKGERISTGKTLVSAENDHVVSVHVDGEAKPDVYAAEWRVVSADGHPISGVISFKVGKTDKELPKTIAETPNLEITNTILKDFLYISFSIVFGVLFVLFVLFPQKEAFPRQMLKRAKILTAIGMGMMGSVVALFLPVQVKTMTFGAALTPELMRTFFGTSTGKLWLTQFILWLILASLFFFLFKGKSRILMPLLAALTLLAIFMTKALSGHSQAQADRIVATTADFLHLISASLWVGGIIALLFVVPKQEAKAMWNRFAIYAMAAFGLLILSGILMSVMNIGQMKNLVQTAYGITLLIKIGLVILMALIGLGHYFYLKNTQKQIPVKTILIEMLLGLLILSAASILSDTKTPPPAPSKPFSEVMADKNDRAKIRLQITPAKVGDNTFIARFLTKEGAVLEAFQQVTFSAKHAGGRAHEFQGELAESGDYVASGLYLNQIGKWEITVRGLTENFETIEQTFTVQIKE